MSNKLETLIRKAGRELADYQVARIFKVPEELAQTPCDFFGYRRDGKAILIEAKMVNRDSLPIGTKPGLLAHQFYELDAANRANAIALVCWARGNEVYTIDVDWIARSVIQSGKKSINWQDLPSYWKRSMNGPDAHLKLLDFYLPLP